MARGHDTSQLGMGALLVSGGIAGVANWTLICPTDVVKSVIQIDEFHQPKYVGTIDAFKKTVASKGLKGFYKGFGPTMAISVPSNVACFLSYEINRLSLG